MSFRRLKLRFGVAAVTAVAALGLSASSASAGILVASAPSCDDQPMSKTFLPWLDLANYTPLAGGDFEGSMSGWTLGGGASVGGSNEPYYVGASSDSSSLVLPAGSNATSATICVGVQHPTVRFFAKRTSGGPLSLATLRVDVVFELFTGDVISLPIGVITNGGSWQPTLPSVVTAALLPLLPGEHTPVAFRFVPQGFASWSVDDVWVDPLGRG